MIEIIKTKDGYMVQHMDGELEGEYLCDAKGDNLFDRHHEAVAVLYGAFDKDQSLLTDDRALLYYTDKLAEHGWYAMGMIHLKDVKDHIDIDWRKKEIEGMPSDEILNRACAHVARKYDFEYTECVEWAVKLAKEIEWEDA